MLIYSAILSTFAQRNIYFELNEKNLEDNIVINILPTTKTNMLESLEDINKMISKCKKWDNFKLTEEEQQTKVYYKHWYNKYLKINLKYGNPKYVYVGNYSNYQVKKIIKLMTNK